jgi:hypothetical protein
MVPQIREFFQHQLRDYVRAAEGGEVMSILGALSGVNQARDIPSVRTGHTVARVPRRDELTLVIVRGRAHARISA